MLEKVLGFQKTSMFLTDTSEDVDAYFRYIASKKKSMFFFEVYTPTHNIPLEGITYSFNVCTQNI